MVRTQCPECGKTFCSKSSLNRHHQHLHQKQKAPSVTCFHCGKKFPRKQTLISHIQVVHPTFADPMIFRGPPPKFPCPECGRQLARKATLMKHIEKQHSACDNPLPANPKSQTCVKCNKDFLNEMLILKHIEKDHGIRLKRETVTFDTWENFVGWKDEVETRTFCRYVKRTTTKLKFEHVVYYYCERRGFHLPPDQRKRREWSHGSKKLNGYCPAKIIARKHSVSGEIRATYCSSHLHSIEPANLKYSPFNDNIRSEVVQKLASQVPIDQILKEVRTNKSREYLEKGQMMTRKDVLNIARSKNLRNLNRKSVKPAVEIETFAEKHGDAILLYKKQGHLLDDYPELRSEDFVLIYMNAKQKEYFQRCGSILAMDEAYGLHEYGFVQHTLMVLDDFDQGYPTCFLFANRNDQTVVELLFRRIECEIGPLKVNTFLSDMQEMCYNAYLKVTQRRPTFHLYCSWRVRKEWKRNLAAIKDGDTKRECEARLCSMLESDDVATFEQMLAEFCSDADPEVANFLEYFRSNFLNNTEQWAYCYRRYSGINTSMVVKSFHRQIKHNFGDGSRITRLQECLALIESYLECREQNDLICNVKGHIPLKVAKLRKAHDAAKRHLETVGIRRDERGWIVDSFSVAGVQYVVSGCGDCQPDCRLKCDECFCCTHMFKCTCLENSIRNVMCKHIHAVCLQQVLEQQVVQEIEDVEISSPFTVYQMCDEDEFKVEKIEDESAGAEVYEQNRLLFESIMTVVASSPNKNRFVRKALEDLEAAVLAMEDHEWEFDDDVKEKIIP